MKTLLTFVFVTLAMVSFGQRVQRADVEFRGDVDVRKSLTVGAAATMTINAATSFPSLASGTGSLVGIDGNGTLITYDIMTDSALDAVNFGTAAGALVSEPILGNPSIGLSAADNLGRVFVQGNGAFLSGFSASGADFYAIKVDSAQASFISTNNGVPVISHNMTDTSFNIGTSDTLSSFYAQTSTTRFEGMDELVVDTLLPTSPSGLLPGAVWVDCSGQGADSCVLRITGYN